MSLARWNRLPVLGALIAATAALLTGVPPADAHRADWRTTTSFGMTASGGEAALGTISSPKARCVNKRKVVLFEVRPGRDRRVGIDRRSGRPRGNGDGYWVIPTDLRPTKSYYARVLAKDVGPAGHRHRCRAYRTSTIPWAS